MDSVSDVAVDQIDTHELKIMRQLLHACGACSAMTPLQWVSLGYTS